MEVGWQVKIVPSTIFSFADYFPQALVYAGKYLRQQKKNLYRLKQKQIFNVFFKSTRRWGRKEDNLWSSILEHPQLQEKSKETEYTEYLTEDLDEIVLS